MIGIQAGDAVLIASISGRALAQSARRGGYRPLVADFFGDQDTVAAAQTHVQVDGGLARGFHEPELMEALERLAAQHPPAGIVCGTGFEDRPHLLAALATRWRLYGNDADKVAKVKDPELFAAICRCCGVPFPEISLKQPGRDGFIAKRRGGSGGAHIASAPGSNAANDNVYYQARVPGRPVSALLLANGVSATVVGLSAQWTSPAPNQPFRYGGAVRPADISPGVADRLGKAACRLTAALTLTGLNSADFMVDGDAFWLLEVNPRPGATLDIFETDRGFAGGPSLFSLHVAACSGDLKAPRLSGPRASAVCYAACDVTAPEGFAWPEWTADRPNGGIAIGAGEPLCTVHAGAAAAAEAKALVEKRLALIYTWMREWTH